MNRTILKQKLPAANLVIAVNLMTILAVSAVEPATNSAAKTPAQEEALNNAAVIELKQLGLGENVVVEKIKSSRCEFDVTLSGLKQLKAAGVSDSIIAAMLTAKPQGKAVAETVAAQPIDPNDPKLPHEAGIWIYEENTGKAKMTQLEPSVYSQNKTGAGIFAQFGETVKRQGVVASAHAGITTSNRQPVFYFYFERTQAGLSDSHSSATSANEYILAQFEVVEKENQRRLVMGSMNAFVGSENGAEGKSIRSFGFEKLAPGIYKVIPKEILPSGEYGFYYSAQTGSGKVFDFGVQGSPETEPKPVVVEKAVDSPKKGGFKNPFKKKTDS
jgi:hypothetical protein